MRQAVNSREYDQRLLTDDTFVTIHVNNNTVGSIKHAHAMFCHVCFSVCICPGSTVTLIVLLACDTWQTCTTLFTNSRLEHI
jgi:hypothetical protein